MHALARLDLAPHNFFSWPSSALKRFAFTLSGRNALNESTSLQDHIVAGVQICQLDRFFTEKEYHQLLFLSLAGLAAELQLPENRLLYT